MFKDFFEKQINESLKDGDFSEYVNFIYNINGEVEDEWYSNAKIAAEKAINNWNSENDDDLSNSETKNIHKFAKDFVKRFHIIHVGMIEYFIGQQ